MFVLRSATIFSTKPVNICHGGLLQHQHIRKFRFLRVHTQNVLFQFECKHAYKTIFVYIKMASADFDVNIYAHKRTTLQFNFFLAITISGLNGVSVVRVYSFAILSDIFTT